MAVTGITVTSATESGVTIAQWAAIPNGNTGTPLEQAQAADRSVQITGTFGAAGSITIQGSNDGTNYYELSDSSGNALTKTAAGLFQVGQVTRFIRPNVTAGDGTTALTVTMCMRQAKD